MTIVVNGEPRTLAENSTIADLLRDLRLDKTACAVELNRNLIQKQNHPAQPLTDGDTVEVVTLVGGG